MMSGTRDIKVFFVSGRCQHFGLLPLRSTRSTPGVQSAGCLGHRMTVFQHLKMRDLSIGDGQYQREVSLDNPRGFLDG